MVRTRRQPQVQDKARMDRPVPERRGQLQLQRHEFYSFSVPLHLVLGVDLQICGTHREIGRPIEDDMRT